MKMHHSMKTKEINFELRGDFITLDALLKATGMAMSGGLVKGMIAQGLVRVDGQTELRKTCKIRAGQSVLCQDTQVNVKTG